jgi:hypothetical protein
MKKSKKQATVVEEQVHVEPKTSTKKSGKVSKEEEKEPVVRRQPVFELTLTKFELLHLRDMMGILLPPDGAQTLSQALAVSEDRTLTESKLWEKLSRLCVEAGLPVDAEAPDYIVAPIAPPPMGVFLVNQEMVQTTQSSGFIQEDSDEEDE